MAIVYLLHWAEPGAIGRHYLGAAASEGAIDLHDVRHGYGGKGQRVALPGALPPIVADVWEVDSAEEAVALKDKFRRQGGRSRLCSVCSPGNGRGGGRGKYQRQRQAK